MAVPDRPCVRIEGAFFVHHSLAHVNRELAVALEGLGWEVAVCPLEEPDWQDATVPHFERLQAMTGRCERADVVLRHAFPPDLSKCDLPMALMQPWEFFAAPDEWVRASKTVADELWCNSSFSRSAYVRSGTDPTRTFSLPLGFDPQTFTPEACSDERTRDDSKEFCFLFVGGTIGRKGIDVLLNAYLNEFLRDEPVRLIVKDTGTRHVYRHNNHALECKRVVGDDSLAKLTYLDDDLSSNELASLYRSSHCLVHPYRAEGFCLPVLEAMACGLPVIVTAGGSTDDLVVQGTGWKVLSRPAGIEQTTGLESSLPQAWLEPDVSDLRAAMRDAFEGRARKTADFRMAAADLAHGHWTWAKVAERYDERLRALLERPRGREHQGTNNCPSISLCMIVRDEERVIEDCLKSARPFFDEVIVVDTGSNDRTKEIAAKYADKLLVFEWCDDFSAARNASLAEASSDWVFWMDADDTLPPDCGDAIVDAARNAPPDVHGFIVPVQFVNDGPGAGTRVDHVKLFRNLPGVRFEGRIHEQILGTLRSHGGLIGRCPAHVLHSGYDTSPEGQTKKRARDEKLLKLDLEDRPGHPFVLFNIGMTAHFTNDHPTAIEWLQKCIAVSNPGDSHVRKAYSMLAVSLRELGRSDESLKALHDGLSVVGEDSELRFYLGQSASDVGRFEEAAEHYERLLDHDASGYYSSVDVGILGFKTRHNLASVYLSLNRRSDAKAQLSRALIEAPTFLISAFLLFDVALEDQDSETAQRAMESVRAAEGPSNNWLEMLVKYAEATHGPERVPVAIEHAVTNGADETLATRACGRWALRRGSADFGKTLLSRIADRDAESAYHLGVEAVQRASYHEALSWMEKSETLNPGHAETLEQIENLRRLIAEEEAGVQ